MNNLIEISEKVGLRIKEATFKIRNSAVRYYKALDVMNCLKRDGIIPENIEFNFVGEKPAKGANGSFKSMKDSVRIQIRCGYGKHNYAPCFELKEKK
jgi:hypothetical protein